MSAIDTIKLLGYFQISGKIRCETGLRIGGSSDNIEIGGIDNPIIRHPITEEPYIPGSSLKGKLRSLLEMQSGLIKNEKPHGCDNFNCPVCRIFGTSEKGAKFGPGRLLARDANICDIEGVCEIEGVKDLTVSEVKCENVINRLSGIAEHPRKMERVPAGAIFSFNLDYRVFDITLNGQGADGGKRDKEHFNKLLLGLRLLEQDSLGGSGSRGYGKIQFTELKVKRSESLEISEREDKYPLELLKEKDIDYPFELGKVPF